MEKTTITSLIEKYEKLIEKRKAGIEKINKMLENAKTDSTIDVEDLGFEKEGAEHDIFIFRTFVKELKEVLN